MSLLGNFCPYLEMSSIERKLCKIWNDILFWQHLDSENNVLTWNLNMKTLLRILNSSCPYLEIFVLTWKWALLKENFVKFEMILFFDNNSENNVLTWNLNMKTLLMSLFNVLTLSSIERKLCMIWNIFFLRQHLDSENNVLTWNLNMKTLLRILNSSCPYLEIFVLTWKWALLKENFVKFEMIFFFDNTLTVRIMSLLGI